MSSSALTGIRVLDLSRLLPGPFLTMILSDLGAEVVKVEAPVGGDYLRQMPPLRQEMSGRYLAVNRDKRSLALDLKSERGHAALLRMVKRADVVVESFRPGVLDRLGLGYQTLRDQNRAIILCSISGYGATGPYVHRAGHDLNYAALAGSLAMGGQPDGAPAMPGIQAADLAGGSLWSATGILAALIERGRTGEGTHLDISMTEGLLTLLAAEIGNLDCGENPSRGNQPLNGQLACYRIYQTLDDKYLAVAALEPKFWTVFNRAIGRPGDPGELLLPSEEQERIAAEIQQILASKTRDRWVEQLAAHDCACEPVLELAELADHPLHQQRGVFFVIDDAELGPIRQLRTPLGRPGQCRRPPRLGEDSRDVLADYGFSAEEIAELMS